MPDRLLSPRKGMIWGRGWMSTHITPRELKERLRFLHPMEKVEAGRGPEDAAVIMLLRLSEGNLFALFEMRARSVNDRWSGQVAFPGGRYKPEDVTLDRTACREFKEETGIDVCISGQMMGFMDKVYPMNQPTVSVTPFVCITTAEYDFTPNDEVEALFWANLLGVRYRKTDIFTSKGKVRWRAMVYEGHIVWGMTQRIIENFIQNFIGGQ